jgi:hypothetical protein
VELLVERAAALDVGKDEVLACIRVPDPAGGGRGRRRQEVRTYPTFTSSLEAVADWLQAQGISQVVMEATGGSACCSRIEGCLVPPPGVSTVVASLLPQAHKKRIEGIGR